MSDWRCTPTTGNTLSVSRCALGGVGVQATALIFGGKNISNTDVTCTEEYSPSQVTSYSTKKSFEYDETNGIVILSQVADSSQDYEDDTAAAAGGVPVGGLYRNGNVVSIRIS